MIDVGHAMRPPDRETMRRAQCSKATDRLRRTRQQEGGIIEMPALGGKEGVGATVHWSRSGSADSIMESAKCKSQSAKVKIEDRNSRVSRMPGYAAFSSFCTLNFAL